MLLSTLQHSGKSAPAAIKAELRRQRQREAQLAAFRREGIYLEEEYRDEIEFYMHEMEVSVQIDLVKPWNTTQNFCAEIHDELCNFYGPATRNSVEHAPLPR